MDNIFIDLTAATKEVKDAMIASLKGDTVVSADRIDLGSGAARLAINVAGATNEEMIDVAKMMIVIVAKSCPYGEADGIKSIIVHVAEDLLGEDILQEEGESG